MMIGINQSFSRKFSCIHTLTNTHSIQVFDWQIKLCRSNLSAAFILSHLISWYDRELQKPGSFSNLLPMPQGLPDSVSLSFKEILTFFYHNYDKATIEKAIQLLTELSIIAIYQSGEQDDDASKYLIFHPNICNQWLAKNNLSNDCLMGTQALITIKPVTIKLTKRERECLNLIAKGFTTKKIADNLGLATETVNTHTKAIRYKTKSTSITQAVVKAFRWGWLV